MPQEARYEAFTASTDPNKIVVDAEDEVWQGAGWRKTTERKWVNYINNSCSMPPRTYAITNARVCITANIDLPNGTHISNGAVGRISAIHHATAASGSPSVSVIIERPQALRGLEVTLSSVASATFTGPGGVQLKRHQLPIELACAMTIHSVQGDTELCIACTMDGTRKNMLWLREMLFTLTTRVESLDGLYLLNFRQHIFSMRFRSTGTTSRFPRVRGPSHLLGRATNGKHASLTSSGPSHPLGHTI